MKHFVKFVASFVIVIVSAALVGALWVNDRESIKTRSYECGYFDGFRDARDGKAAMKNGTCEDFRSNR